MPRPQADFLEAIISGLESHVPNVKSTASLYVSPLDEVVLVHMISRRPDDACGRRFRFRFRSKLDGPTPAFIVINYDLFRSARCRTAHKLELARRVRGSLAASGAVKQVTTLDIG